MLLLHYTADILAQDNDGNAPIHLCCSNGHEEVGQQFLQDSSNPHLKVLRGVLFQFSQPKFSLRPIVPLFKSYRLKPIFHLATLFARREAKTRIRQRDWLKLACERIRCEQVGSVPTFLYVRA